MKKVIYVLFALLVICIISQFLSNPSYEEPFVPKIIKESYRPFERNFRHHAQHMYDKTTNHFSNYFRKIGIL